MLLFMHDLRFQNVLSTSLIHFKHARITCKIKTRVMTNETEKWFVNQSVLLNAILWQMIFFENDT